MIITEEKIKVTEQDMFYAGLSKMFILGTIGIPFSKDIKEPITWKSIGNITEEDFNLIEEYFIQKQNKQNHEQH